MNLKQSDKMIAVALVAILIVAAIGIILYADKDDEIDDDTDKNLLYKVETKIFEGTLSVESENGFVVQDKLFKNRDVTFTGTLEVPSDNLKSVNICVEYEDKDFAPIFKKQRANTFTLKVYDESENEVGMAEITGAGKENITINGGSPKRFDDIEAKNDQEAREMLDENITETDMMKTYTIEAKVVNGESPLRLLAWLLEGSQSFDLEVTYEYYYYDLMEPEEIENDNSDDVDSTGLWASTPYVSTNYIGFQ